MGFIGVITFTLTGPFILATLVFNEPKESDTFRCYTAAYKQTSDNFRDRCYEEYDKMFNKRFPLYVFYIFNFCFVVLDCVVYSQYANKLESPRQSNRDGCQIFGAYLAHLLIRIILLALSLILQWILLYPDMFPDAFDYPTTWINNSAGLNSTSRAAQCSCKNPQARTKTICGFLLCADNVQLLVFSLGEVLYLLFKAATIKNFIMDEQFISSYLPEAIRQNEEQNRTVPDNTFAAGGQINQESSVHGLHNCGPAGAPALPLGTATQNEERARARRENRELADGIHVTYV